MLGADLAVAAHDSATSQWMASDYWSAGFSFPTRDTQQDVTLVSVARHSTAGSGGGATDDGGSTLVALRRPLESCDPNGQDRPVLNDTRQTVVFAFGRGAFGYHGTANRGQAEVNLVPSATAAAAAPAPALPALTVLDMRMPNFTVPAAPTTYECVNVELPSDAKYHIYRFEPIIDNTPFVHHFVAYACAPGAAPSTAPGVPYSCGDYMECEEFYMGWAPGVGAIDAPPSAALAFGQGSIRYLSLQVHYTNLNGAQGQVDSSGFRLLYSPTLKKFDMGVLTIGSYDIAVPPGATSYTTAPNVCPSACLGKLVAGSGAGAEGLTLVESFYHMHQLGRSMITKHVRGNVELPPLGRRDYFQFDYQAAVDIPPATRTLLPGDTLITTCTYTGAGRSNVTKFGLASYEEMCFNFLNYYPYNPNITHCVGVAEINMATCATGALLDKIRTEADVQKAADTEELVPLPPNDWSYKPYQPTCKRTAPYQTADDDDDDDSSYGPHHRRNVGGAVAAILIITVLGGVAVFVVFRVMRKRRQAEEEQHLFEKYNPSSISLPVVPAVGPAQPGGLGTPGFGAGAGPSTSAGAGTTYNNGYQGLSSIAV
ncbi:hypothetical protein GPECTOR_77g33 [Gonium pectorale]|uniref:DOMON domain-containing protein n=1 Tax=Gonium pectorale TaxID=33097 RepID=A0A150G258_GONPE|nr:hypothetical protein GPECTOR_77g33 [Gonium pectorale]|eukprot:KXZ43937.1 hypothetical protein GPECTOR_77g33 [Gonium pectorale]